MLSFQRRLLIKGTLIDFNTQTAYSHKLEISTRSTFKLCFKNEVLWQIILLETGNPFTLSITGHPTLAVENSSAQWSLTLLLPYFEKARDFTTGLPGKVMEG